ncbi:MAG: tetratricopeptide repeat protein [Gemmataceae bacterium]
MRVCPGVCLLLLGIGGTLSAADLAEARLRLLKGNYEEAREQYEELLADAKTAPAAALGISRVHQARGEYDPALAVVDKALSQAARNADLLARRGELLHLAGRWDEALKAADEALTVDARHLAARWVRAQVLRDRGDIKEADAEVKKMVRQYSDGVNTDKEIKDPEMLLLVGQASAENARWNGLADEFQAILEDLYGDAIKFDPAFWPAEYHAGLLLLEKYNRGEALDAFDKALKINPSAAEVLAARGVVAMGRFEMKDAERFAESALKVNPNLPEALRVRADVYLAVGDVPSALRELERARKVAPRDERTLSRLAACHHLQGKKAEQQAIVAEVEKASKKPALFWFDLGERLEERRRYDEAEKCFRKASELRPELSGPLNSLGLLYMRLGKEADAKQLLEKGFQADRFNVRVSNMRKVIQHLSGYEDLKTAHFIIRHDPKRDAVLARYIADQLETMYQELAKKFDYRPEGLIPIEIFRNHDMFSGRTVALPDLHTIGACTGKVVTMVSPNERNAKGEPVRKPFNWSRVLRHELVHIFNLAQTNYLVPHWFTEGLAVANEGFPRPPAWNQLLLERVASNRLMNLDTIDLGFIRPRDPLEWQQAYAQAQLYVEYIEKKFGPQAVSKLLASFAAGKSTIEALQDALKTDKATFETGYRAHLDEVVKELRGNRPTEKRRTLEQLQAEYKKDPRDVEVAAELAQRLVSTRRAEARKIAEEVLERQPAHPRALYTLSLLARRAADSKQERSLLEKALNKEQPDPLILRPLGKLYYEQNEFARAAEMYELARKVDRFDRDTLLELARIYAQLQDPTKQIAVLKEVVPLDADDLDRRVRLARLLSEQGDFAGAERYAREALEIDVLNSDAREWLWTALKKQNKDEEEARLRKLLAGESKEP